MVALYMIETRDSDKGLVFVGRVTYGVTKQLTTYMDCIAKESMYVYMYCMHVCVYVLYVCMYCMESGCMCVCSVCMHACMYVCVCMYCFSMYVCNYVCMYAW